VAKKPYKSEEAISKISIRIKELRVNAGFSSYENFAIEHNLDRKQYWRAENGSNLTIKSLVKILNIHKISFSEFYKDI
jgi:transcriptional regulator with XRE-family HTH domain